MKRIKRYLSGILILCLPVLLQGEGFKVKVIKSMAELPEQFNISGKEGDILVSDGTNLILFGGTERVLRSYYQYPIEHTLGSVLGYVPEGKNFKCNMVIGSPYIRIKNRSRYLNYSSFSTIPRTAEDGSLLFFAVAHYKGEKGENAEVTTRYRLTPGSGIIDITSTVKNTGRVRLEELHFSLYFNSGQVYYFSPFDDTDSSGSSGSSTWSSRLPFRIYPRKGHYLGWMALDHIRDLYQPIAWESVSKNLDPGKSFEARYMLLVDVEAENILKNIYRVLGVQPAKVTIDTAGFQGEFMEVVVQDMSSRVFFRSFFVKPQPLVLMLPQGLYSIRANFFPAVVETLLSVEQEKEYTCLLQDPPKGKIRVSIKNKAGAFVPGKTTFIGLDPTKTPYFKPENPLETNNSHEYFKNSCFPQEEGLEVYLPVGTYVISASRGPEYTLDQRVVEVHRDSRLELIFRIDKIVDTTNLVSVDLHLHTLNSDGSVTISERIKSVVAEGVDVAISTDHNFLSDYKSILEKLGLDRYLSVLIGQEVSALDVNQVYMPEFNRFPLKIREGEPGNGAIDIRFFENNTPILGESRRKDPGALIQVNHPRRVEGYFTYYQLDPETAATALKGFDTSFDLLEVMNGPSFYSMNQRVIRDWFHLLNRGYYFPITGSSDSHRIDKAEPGYSRTYVYYDGKKGRDIDSKALRSALKRGRSFVSNGPVVEFTINSQHIPGDLLTEKSGQVDVMIRVQAAPWISVDEVRVIVNGERKIILPVKAPREQILKFQEKITLKLKDDSYIAIEVLGSETLFPVVQKRSKKDGRYRGPLPYALTNPIFVDVDGNGTFDSPLPKIKFLYH
jgi:hypothetical protein